ncbi:MAG: transposase [Bacilli bacterium]|nr:transposase [Bacilli bacterium]
MKIKKTYKFRIYPKPSQKELIEKTLGCVRQVYNDFLAMCIEKHAENPDFKINKYDLIKMLPEYKETFPYLKEVDSIALQQAIIHLHIAYTNFFRHNAEFPKFKKKKNDHGYTTMNVISSVRLNGNEIQIPKIGKVRCINSFNIPDDFSFTTVTVVKQGHAYFVCLNGEQENTFVEDVQKALDPTNSIGLDFSMSSLYVDSDGKRAEMPRFYEDSLEKLAKLSRNASRCKKGSKNSIKAYAKLKKLQQHIVNQKKDYLHKLSYKLANQYDYVFVEDLDIKSMQSKDNDIKFGLELLDRCYSTFLNLLSYKLEWRGKKLIKVSRYYPSSKTCSCCGYKNDNLTLSTRNWTCPNCGIHHNRDVNAAINIKNEGLRLLALNQTI